ncbi:MAG: EFR1 family ferrodoxin [Candidatus Methanomethylophilus sp.]|nr:EFR1 family ferrodoxin [Methanomethylophilus sp.]MDD3233226.1 EFR1 family ferrodoxin [Methanomethylophilus sp.]MDD4222482.1 EFR1 family ferrodoxin [Methanomethylophilus sp.]
MILWYSGTGNSRFAAEQIAVGTGERAVSMNDLIREGGKPELSSALPFVFVFPTYAWRPPECVVELIKRIKFRGSSHAYFIMTASGDVGDSEKYLRELCETKALLFMGLGAVRMPQNYAARFELATVEEDRQTVQAAVPVLREISKTILAGQPLDTDPEMAKETFKSHHLNGYFKNHMNSDRPFRVTDRCTGCGQCSEQCVMHDIVMQDGRPVWQGHCNHCMSCYGNCPTEAIEFGSKTEKRPKYSFFKLDFGPSLR